MEPDEQKKEKKNGKGRQAFIESTIVSLQSMVEDLNDFRKLIEDKEDWHLTAAIAKSQEAAEMIVTHNKKLDAIKIDLNSLCADLSKLKTDVASIDETTKHLPCQVGIN
jgi:hypothetical protein